MIDANIQAAGANGPSSAPSAVRARPADEGAPSHPASAPRHTLLIRSAKIVGRSGEALCILRDASADEIRIKRFTRLPDDPELDIVLPNGQRHAIVQAWENGDAMGFRFVEPIDIERLIAEAPTHLRKGEISLNCLVPGVISSRSGECDVKIHDISQHGARIECGLHLAMNERVQLTTEVLPPLTTTVEWRRAPYYRLLFDRVFAFDELARMSGVVGPPPPPRREA